MDMKIGGMRPSYSLCIILLRDNLGVLRDKARLLYYSCGRHHQFLHEKSVEADDKFFGSLRMGVHDLGKVWLQAETSSTRALSSFYVRSPCKVHVQQ